MRRAALLLVFGAASLAGCATMEREASGGLQPGARYVAMGSSFAAGPGVTASADTPENRCSRSTDNYARQLARRRNLDLVDVSCGGATTAHILGPWNELPAQLDALTADTALVTVTIGGNDVSYIGSLMMGSCAGADVSGDGPVAAMCRGMQAMRPAAPAGSPPPVLAAPSEEAWGKLAQGVDRIVAEVRSRAPRARLVFVDYPQVLSDGPLCPVSPLNPAGERIARDVAVRLAQVTGEAARRGGAELVSLARVSGNHGACSPEPWVTGMFPATPPASGARRFAPYHPNLAGMTAAADLLDKVLLKAAPR